MTAIPNVIQNLALAPPERQILNQVRYKSFLLIAALSLLITTFTMSEGMEDNPIPLKFSDLDAPVFANKPFVEIRGFLYEGEGGKKILSSEPNLRTCCVGAKAKRKKQILIVGEVGTPDTQFPVTIRGTFIAASHLNENDEGPMHRLEQAAIISGNSNFLAKEPVAIIAGIIFAVVILSFGIRRLQQMKKRMRE